MNDRREPTQPPEGATKPPPPAAPPKVETAPAEAPKPAVVASKGDIILPDGSALTIRRSDEKGVVLVLATVVLSEGAGLTAFPTRKKDEDGNWITVKKYEVDGDGFRKLNRFAGLAQITPATVVVDGEVKKNPCYVRDSSGIIQRIVIRKAVSGPAPTGNLVAVEKTLDYDSKLYLLEALLSLAEYTPDAAELGSKDEPPTVFRRPIWKGTFPNKYVDGYDEQTADGKSLRYFPIDDEDGIWVDRRHPKYLQTRKDHVRRVKFLSRAAETTCLRLCYQDHPAIAVKKVLVGVDGKARLPVYYHRDLRTKESLDAIRDEIDNRTMETGENLDGLAKVEIHSENVTLGEDGEAQNVLDAELEDAAESEGEAKGGSEEKSGPSLF